MRVGFALMFVAAWSPSALAQPTQPTQPTRDVLTEIDASLAPQEVSTRGLLAIELPRLIVSAIPRARHTILDNPFMRALFKGVRVPGLDTPRAQLRAPEQRIMMLALRPRAAGGYLRFRVRFDSGLFSQAGPLRRFLGMRRDHL